MSRLLRLVLALAVVGAVLVAPAVPAAPAVVPTVAAQAPPKTWYHREVIGRSHDGRKITAYRAGQAGKPVVVVLATMHGDETSGRHVALGLLKGKKITGVDLWVIPVVNPDGYAHHRRWLAHGVDPNRNYPHRFARQPHSGSKAASAVETRVMMTFLDRVDPAYVISWHQPLYGVDSYAVKDRALMHQLSTRLHLPVRRFACRSTCHGTLTGWFNAHHDGAAITVEYGSKRRSVARMEGHDANAVLHAVGGKRRS